MIYRHIMNGELKLSAISLGCMAMSEFYGAHDESESLATIQLALDSGINYFDTADAYGTGHNERLVGRALKPYRDKIILATKFGIERTPDGQWVGINGKPEYVKKACEASLQRLGFDTIDLYYYHRKDPEVPIEETVGAMAELVKEGKVRFLGLSEMSAQTLERARKVHPIAAMQSEYSLWTRDVEKKVLPACRKNHMALVAYSPLGRGFLTGKIKSLDQLAADDYRRNIPRFQGENFRHNLQVLAEIEALARELNCTPAQLAISWLLHQGEEVVALAGTSRRNHLSEILKALEIQLSEDVLHQLDEISRKFRGERYSESGMKRIEVDE